MTCNDPWWEHMLRADEVSLAYFAQRTELPGVTLFCAEREDAPEFDVALLYRVPGTEIEITVPAIAGFYHERGRCPRVRLSPCSSPADWPQRLTRAGFVETDERFVYFSVPPALHLRVNPAVRVARSATSEDADQFSAIQVIGFDIPSAHQEWDRQLARYHLAKGQHTFYLARLEDRVVGGARCIHLPGGMTAMAALATRPDARGQGVGTTLLAHMIADARARKSRIIFGNAIPGSDAAGIYHRLGFTFHFTAVTFAAGGEPLSAGVAANVQ